MSKALVKACFIFLVISCLKDMSVQAGQLEERLEEFVVKLSHDIGERNYIAYEQLNRAADFIAEAFRSYGLEVENQAYKIEGQEFRNVIAIKRGEDFPDKIVVVGAHYDSVVGSPGADDNASGVAGLLILAELLSKEKLPVTVKFIAFTNEEPPFFQSDMMGSMVYANQAKEAGEDIEVMICLESIGYYLEKKGSQNYPPFLRFFYPSEANFIALVGDTRSARYVKDIKKIYQKHSDVPMETLIGLSLLAPAVGFSDHASFWKNGYKAVMLTDSAFYRTPHYHTREDTYEKLDYKRIAQVIKGLSRVVVELCNNLTL